MQVWGVPREGDSGVHEETGTVRGRRVLGGIVMGTAGTGGEVERGVRSGGAMDGIGIETGIMSGTGTTDGTTEVGIATMQETGIAGRDHIQDPVHHPRECNGETGMNRGRIAGGENGQ